MITNTVTAVESATELRESIMALTRQLRRHRSDNGLTLSQQQVLGEVSRAGVTTPAELATCMHVRVQSLTDGINTLEARGLIARRTDVDDLALGCPKDNRAVKPDGWTTRKRGDGRTEWIPPPHLDSGQSRVNDYHHPENYLLPDDEPTTD